MGGVAAFDIGAKRPTLDGLAQNDGGRPAAEVVDGGHIRGIELVIVVPTAREVEQIVVGQVRDHLAQPWVGAKEVLANEVAIFDRVTLKLAVDGVVHLIEQHAVGVGGQQVVPLGSPDHLDHVPAGTAERGLEFLDDLAVAAHGTIESLQVAVDHEDQVVELLSARQRNRPERFGFVALTVAQKCPHAALAGVVKASVV
ncbi:unannotated protein [freshwater metagenome]|uniref:Unannotated protein n=1 Tax=freshwater metagenome TaxID=449393 RepID=A0A6J6YIB7_9ZZZZ